MTDGLHIVRIRARNVHRVHGHKRVGKRQCRVLNSPGRHYVETKKNRIWTTCACLAVASMQEICDTKCEQPDCNKSSARLKFRTSAFSKIVYNVKNVYLHVYIAYNFSHFAIYLPKLIKIRGNLTKF